jgi:Chitobiase/beta-hexosaminidase C-terminal domain
MSTVQTPTVVPSQGNYAGPVEVSLFCTTPNASIYYSTNGSAPTTSDPYGGPFLVKSTTTVQAFAALTGWNNSAVVTTTITITTPTVATPTIIPNGGGPFTGSVWVSLYCATAGAKIYYTTNSTAPTTSSTLYAGNPFPVSSTSTVQAIAVFTGYNDSDVATANITITAPTVATPTIAPSGGNYAGPVGVSLFCSTPGATIKYTTNGTPPLSGTAYGNTPFVLPSTFTGPIQAIATLPGSNYNNSAVASANFTVA